MELNFLLFPAPRTQRDPEILKDHLIWIPIYPKETQPSINSFHNHSNHIPIKSPVKAAQRLSTKSTLLNDKTPSSNRESEVLSSTQNKPLIATKATLAFPLSRQEIKDSIHLKPKGPKPKLVALHRSDSLRNSVKVTENVDTCEFGIETENDLSSHGEVKRGHARSITNPDELSCALSQCAENVPSKPTRIDRKAKPVLLISSKYTRGESSTSSRSPSVKHRLTINSSRGSILINDEELEQKKLSKKSEQSLNSAMLVNKRKHQNVKIFSKSKSEKDINIGDLSVSMAECLLAKPIGAGSNKPYNIKTSYIEDGRLQ